MIKKIQNQIMAKIKCRIISKNSKKSTINIYAHLYLATVILKKLLINCIYLSKYLIIALNNNEVNNYVILFFTTMEYFFEV